MTVYCEALLNYLAIEIIFMIKMISNVYAEQHIWYFLYLMLLHRGQ